MNKKLLFLVLINLSLTGNQVEINAFEKWDSPTPWIRDRSDDFLNRMPQEAIVVEVGVHRGEYAELILKKTNPQSLYLIDCWEYQDPIVYDDSVNLSNDIQEECFLDTQRRFEHDPRVIIIRKFSKNAVEKFADESLDWVYIDANHSYNMVSDDLSLW